MAGLWTVRAGRESDVAAMYALDLVCFDEPFRFDLAAMRRFVLERDAIVVVAEAAGELAGFVVIHPAWRRRQVVGYVVTLDIAPRFRRLGLAGELMALAEEQSVRAGAATMALHVHAGNAAAIAFYERAGYARGAFSAGFYGEGMDAWVYNKRLQR